MKSKKKAPERAAQNSSTCIVCGKPATTMVDGQPSCEEHIELVYEDQVEDYTKRHLADEEWLEKVENN